ncbi:EAL domain-containing protein [Shewanella sp. 4t3-1-2LB]|uniref:EAL domain-containing protein n=1 Tax=Shewanella sp. 4t3-1-2LB TaxID=2817682 RepID=UPI001A9967A9|nr:EAL domain-containing protein [Shewanella sp. 4t3-1-2LB]MBO1271005.1 EAL domain-containing protein [Shewanella sp. 4t3-1-2LB]
MLLFSLGGLSTPLPAVTLSQLRFEHINSLNGLHQNSIYSLFEDKGGMLWIGTQDGLQSYNGTDFNLFLHDPFRNDSLSDSFITDIVQSSDGTIWVGTYSGGINLFQPGTGNFRRYGAEQGLKSLQVVEMATVGEQLWVGTTQGLYRLSNDKSRLLPVAVGQSAFPVVTSLHTLDANSLFISTADSGAYIFRAGQWLPVMLPPGKQQVRQVSSAPDHSIWLTKGDSLWHYPSLTAAPELIYQLPHSNQIIHDIAFVSADNIWLGGDGSGLINLQRKEGKWHDSIYRYSPFDASGLSDNDIFNLLLDKHGNLWVGTRYSGLNRINITRQYFAHIYNQQDPFNQQHFNNFRAIFRGSDGNLYLGTNNAGLFRLDNAGHFHSYNAQFAKALNIAPQMLHLRIMDIAEDNEHQLWLATSSGLAKLTLDGQLTVYAETTQLGFIRTLTIDAQQRLWFGAGRQLYQFDRQTAKATALTAANNILPANDEPQQVILNVKADPDGLWVSTMMGAYHFNPDNGEKLVIPGKDLPHPFVRDVLRTQDGSIWLATHGGLSRYYHGKLTHISQQHGLPNNTIYALAEDHRGYLWFSSNSGISRLDPNSYDIESFNENEGLQALEFNGGVRWQDKDGSIWFGGINGLNHFYPADIPPRRDNIQISLAAWQLGAIHSPYYRLDKSHQITLPYSDKVLTFEVTSNDFSYPGHDNFSFFLEGQDSSWTPLRNQHVVSYTNLAPGHYRLWGRYQLDGNRLEEPQLLADILIQPPYYRTIWAYFTYVVLAASLLGLMTRHYFQQRYHDQRIQQEINASEKRLRLALLGSGGRMWDWQLKQNRLYITSQQDGDEYSEEIDRQQFYKQVHPDDLPRITDALQRYIIGETPFYEAEYRLKNSDGNWSWGLDRGKAVEWDKQGNPVRMAGTLTDISLRKRQEDQLRLSYQVLESMNEAVVTTDLDYRVIDVNPAFTHITGFTEKDIKGRPVLFLTRGLYPRSFYQQAESAMLHHRSWAREMQIHTHRGKLLPVWMEANQVLDASGHTSHLVMVFNDITERKKAEEDLRLMANYDQLTDLPNRTLFQDRLQHALAQATRSNTKVALLFLDLDRFKNINDTRGHQVGDQLLAAVAERLRRVIREGDTVARIGGDEFTIILEGVHKTKAATVIAEKITETLKQPFAVGQTVLDITTSIGISMFPDDADNTEELLKFADTAMYHAKAMGRNNFQFYTASMNQAAVRHMQLESGLKQALTNNELHLVYQPKYEVKSGKLTGMEALLRWHSEKIGQVSPAEFIPLAEETGMINTIGVWVLQQVCQQLALWRQQGLQLIPVAINLSAKQLNNYIVDEVTRALTACELPAELLELELTESAVMQHPAESIAILARLEALGLTLAVDDFGTGYSSLAYLKRFPIHTLKIDKEFVRDISDDPEDAAITSAIIALAHSLDLQVVAEGVETQEQLNFLADHDCDQVQGYLLGKPMLVSECSKLLQPAVQP